MTDVMGSHIEYSIGSMTQMLPQIRASNIKPIAVTSAERSEAAPDVPTLQEAGLSDYEVLQWWGVLRSEEHTSELQSLMRISYAVFCLKKKKEIQRQTTY